MGGLGLLVRTDLRARWRSVAALTILVGLAGTFVLTAATGARRTDSALERFLDATMMWDASIEVDYPATDAVVADVASQPEVVAASAVVYLPLSNEALETGVISGLTPEWLREVYRPRIMAGRLPDPSRVDELLVSEATAERAHLAVHDVVVLEDWVGAGVAQPLTIVGIHRGVIDLALNDTYPGGIATGAFGRRVGDAIFATVEGTEIAGQIRPQVVARMRGDVDDPVRVLEAVAARHDDARPRVVDRSPFVSPLERALAVQVEAFWILTAVSGLSALLLLGMAVARLAAGSTHPDQALRALGVAAGSRSLATLAIPALVTIVGCVLAVAGAMVASPLVPLGSARLVEPDPGIWIDPVTLSIGGLALAAGLTVVAATLTRLDKRSAQTTAGRPPSTLPLPLPAALGRDLAYRGSRWGRLALAATGLGVALLVAVSVYRTSLDRLMGSPELSGSDYDVELFPADETDPEAPFADVDLDHPAVVSVAIARGAFVGIAGDLLEAQVIDPIRGEAGGTILRGRAPRAADEVALGPTTLHRLGLGVGGEVQIAGSRERSMRIVGEVVLAPPGQAGYGDVTWLTPSAAENLGLELLEPKLLLDLADGTSPADRAAIIGESYDNSSRVPDEVSNLDGVGRIPEALAIFGGLLGGAVLTFAMVGVVRTRRKDIAILRTLGLSPLQVRGSVFAAGLLIVGPGAAIGVAAGVVLGRGYWSVVAARVPALVQSVVSLQALALIAGGGLAVACLVVIAPIHLAMRRRPAEVLRRD